MKDIKSTIKVIYNEQQEKYINKQYNFTILSQLKDRFKLVKYKSRLDDRFRKLIKYLENDSLQQLKQEYSINKLKGFNKAIEVPSHVQIAAFVSAYGKISINKYKIYQIICVY